MNDLPKRKQIRVKNYDYSTCGAYFITICTANREKLFWNGCRGELRSPADVPLSDIGVIVDREIRKLDTVYESVRVKKYCIMPDHIHMILSIDITPSGPVAEHSETKQVAPTISRVVKQFKGIISKQVGRSIWQKSFYDHGIRGQDDYDEIWRYIENNPLKYTMTAP